MRPPGEVICGNRAAPSAPAGKEDGLTNGNVVESSVQVLVCLLCLSFELGMTS